tara:strand:- start:5275 stop:5544 length:270 start_codon:yes stop_codon:yes gene_type:complete
MNEEIEKAYKALDGVWPKFLEKETKISVFTVTPIHKDDRRLALCLDSHESLIDGDTLEGMYYGVGSRACKNKFKIICTREEFDEYGNYR